MFVGLRKRVAGVPNIHIILGDFLEPNDVLPDLPEKTVFLFLQNTLGTIEGGSAAEALKVIINQAKSVSGELVLSLFRQPALESWGIRMYQKISKMLGRMDTDKTVIERGVFVTDTDYTSKWWTDEEIENFRQMGHVEAEVLEPEFCLLRLSF